MDKGSNSGLRIFVIGNRGYASKILEELLLRSENVVGICSERKPSKVLLSVKKGIRSLLLMSGLYKNDPFIYIDPFEVLREPIDIASRNNISILDAKDMNKPEFEAKLRALNPDLILVAGFRFLIPGNIIQVAKIATINFHPSLLPKHRGGTPNRWIVRNGENKTGVSVHFVNERFDRGDIILQEKIDVEPDDTWGELEFRITDKMVDLIETVLKMVKEGSIKGIPQDHKDATYDPPIKVENNRIDWSQSPLEIKRLSYAMKSKSSGITSINKKKMCVWDLEEINREAYSDLPGAIIDFDREGYPIVGCGKGVLKILSFLQNGTIVKANKVIKKEDIRKGMRFE